MDLKSGSVPAKLFSIGLALGCFSGRWGDMGIPLPLDRALLICGAVGALAAYRLRDDDQVRFKPVHLAMVLATAWALLSAIAAGSIGGTGFYALIDRFGIGLFVVFALAPIVYFDAESRVFLLRTFGVLGVYLSVTTIAEGLDLDFLVWPSYILDPAVGIHFDRGRGPFVEAVANGMVLSYCAAFGAATAYVDQSARWRWLGLGSSLLCAVGVLLTLTRAVWIGAVLAAIVVVLVVPSLRKWAIPGAAVMAALISVIYFNVPGLSESAEARAGDEYPVWDRLNTNAAAVRMVLANPVNGVGWHESVNFMTEYIRQGDTYPVSVSSAEVEVHNVFLSRLAEVGIPGFALWFSALFGAVAFALVRRPKQSRANLFRVVLLAVFVVWLTAAMFGPTSYVQPNYVLWVLGGIALTDYLIEPSPETSYRGVLYMPPQPDSLSPTAEK